MLNENPNNDFHWKSKLESLESLPGEIFNKEAAWDKLHGRLHKKNTNKKLVWLYAAAACLLVALVLPRFWAGEKKNVLVKNITDQNHIPRSNVVHSTFNKKDSIVVVSSTPVEHVSPVSRMENDNRKVTAIDHKTLSVENVAIRQDEEKMIEPDITKTTGPLDTQINIVVIIPEKKKLHVVHVNELGDPQEQSPVIAHQAEMHTFQMKFANQEVFVNPSTTSSKTRFTILSSKNSPN